ncbi:MAG: selenocysteine-specific translation elongation factor [Planctomycetota bacterium]|nr:selenocysteine-specific translation elongation factor [Planctomycetota bacterium]
MSETLEKKTGEAADARIFNVVLGTAGHIDHGKSSLVQALTGIHPDRLKEEQERGITIDLGFAPLDLSNGTRVGIIDVPGHERFIKNMVAGATGIDFVLMVVAADDGVMAQTREHLQILRLLGVPDGLTVITKTDLVESAFADLVAEEVAKLSAGTCLEGKPVLRVSSKTGEGLPELRAALERRLSGLARRSDEGPFRMPVQRVFAKEGFGTVVTGVPVSGTVAIGDQIEIQPLGVGGRVKGLHAYKHKIERGRAGHSTAVNVAGIERHEVVRGMVAATPGVFRPSTLFAAHLIHLADAPYALKHRAPVRFHAGTVEIMGKVLMLQGESLPPGAEGFVQILLEEPTVLVPGDRYILRHQSPVVTLGGGQILDNAQQKRKRDKDEERADLAARHACLGDRARLLGLLLDYAARPQGAKELGAALGALPETLAKYAETLKKEKHAVVLKQGETYVGMRAFEALAQATAAALTEFFKEHPALGSIERPELKRRIAIALTCAPDELPWFDDLLNALSSRALIKCDGNQVALAGRERKLDARWAERARQAESLLKAGLLAPPDLAEIEAQLRIPPKDFKEVMKYLTETGAAVEAAPGLCFHAELREAPN